MTNEQINAAIAEACGFVGCDEFQLNKDGPKFRFWDYPKTWMGPNKQPWCPDFCTDLNAMHEAERIIADKGVNAWWIYCGNIVRSMPAIFGNETAVMASARQRAEAFLRTLGKWEEVQG